MIQRFSFIPVFGFECPSGILFLNDLLYVCLYQTSWFSFAFSEIFVPKFLKHLACLVLENGSVFTEIFQVCTCVWFSWALFVESKDNIWLFCLCMGFAAFSVATELAVGRIHWRFFG